MPAEKTTGIILKVIDFSETSCVVTMYTRDFGKVTALAKGARRLRSPFEGAIDLLASCRIVFLRKSVDKLDILTEAKLLRRFRSASTDLSRFYSGLYVIELVSSLTDSGDPHPELYDLVSQAIYDIDNESTECTVNEAAGDTFSMVVMRLTRFQLQLLNLLGHQPSLYKCVHCGIPIDEVKRQRQRVSFGMLAGGVYCESCRGGKRSVVGLRPITLTLMRQLADSNTSLELALDSIEWDRSVQGELRGLVDQYLADLIGYRPKMQTWLKNMFRNEPRDEHLKSEELRVGDLPVAKTDKSNQYQYNEELNKATDSILKVAENKEGLRSNFDGSPNSD